MLVAAASDVLLMTVIIGQTYDSGVMEIVITCSLSTCIIISPMNYSIDLDLMRS